MRRTSQHSSLPPRRLASAAVGDTGTGAAAPDRHARPVPDGELQVEIRRGGVLPLVVVSGELDSVGAPLLTAVLDYLRSTWGGPVAVDLSEVPCADTHGLHSVLGAGSVVVGASPSVRRLLAVLGVPVSRGHEPSVARSGVHRKGTGRAARSTRRSAG